MIGAALTISLAYVWATFAGSFIMLAVAHLLLGLGGGVSRIISGLVADRLRGHNHVARWLNIALFLYLPYDGLISFYVVSVIFGLWQGASVPATP